MRLSSPHSTGPPNRAASDIDGPLVGSAGRCAQLETTGRLIVEAVRLAVASESVAV